MSSIDFSIIIPVYKVGQADFVQCITSCSKQNGVTFEILIIVNGLDKHSQKKLLSWIPMNFKNIRIILSKEKGVSAARNLGIQKSKGQWILFVDADDWIEPNSLLKIKTQIMCYPQCTIFVTPYKKNFNGFEEFHEVSINGTIDSEVFRTKIYNFIDGYGTVWGKVWNGDFVRNNLLFDSNLSLMEDADFCINATQFAFHSTSLSVPFYHYRVSSSSSVVRAFRKDYANRYYSLLEYLIDKYSIDTIQFSSFIAFHVMLVTVNYAFNQLNELSYFKQKSLLKKQLERPIFKLGIKYAMYTNFTLPYKVSLFALKHKLYLLLKIISSYRSRQR